MLLPVLEEYPLKQGLKLNYHVYFQSIYFCIRGISIKTRIEATQRKWWKLYKSLVLEEYPLKQGLKLKVKKMGLSH